MSGDQNHNEEASTKVIKLRDAFNSGRTRSYEWRRAQLQGLLRMLRENEMALGDAMHADLGRSHFEGWGSETNFVANEINHSLKHLRDWMKPERVPTPTAIQPGNCHIHREPLGVALVLGAWNYPLQLALAPAAAVILAGNCVLIKPSEISPACSKIIAELLPRYVDNDCIQVIEGGIETSTALLAQRFDHIFYTGGAHVGRIVMTAAAKHLCPVTLELGGKSPAIVDRSARIGVAARRIVRGKFWNTGQTCVAPDYALVHEDVIDDFIAEAKKAITRFYGDDPSKSRDIGRIINDRHFERLSSLMEGGKVLTGGETDAASRYIAPTLLGDVDLDSKLMTDEIFGPLLPIIKVASTDEAIAFVNEREKPLALYVFTGTKTVEREVLSRTSSGGACVNETLMHLVAPDLPFGGVGPSGMGAYHGRTGFETYSHRKSVLSRSTLIDPAVAYPPFTDGKQKIARRFM
jgi:aldehyde dehydrogenase (NAD+)